MAVAAARRTPSLHPGVRPRADVDRRRHRPTSSADPRQVPRSRCGESPSRLASMPGDVVAVDGLGVLAAVADPVGGQHHGHVHDVGHRSARRSAASASSSSSTGSVIGCWCSRRRISIVWQKSSRSTKTSRSVPLLGVPEAVPRALHRDQQVAVDRRIRAPPGSGRMPLRCCRGTTKSMSFAGRSSRSITAGLRAVQPDPGRADDPQRDARLARLGHDLDRLGRADRAHWSGRVTRSGSGLNARLMSIRGACGTPYPHVPGRADDHRAQRDPDTPPASWTA